MEAWWLVAVAYVVGSIPVGLLVVRVARRIDVRHYGSGSTGVTNVLRTSGPGLAALALMGDAGNGAGMVAAATMLSSDDTLRVTVASTVVAGHIWPVFAGFRGGRGIATGIAAAAVLSPLPALVGMAVFVPVVVLTRFVSLGSVLGVMALIAAIVVAVALGYHSPPYLGFALGTGSLILLRHTSNIRRLLRGTEHRLGQRIR